MSSDFDAKNKAEWARAISVTFRDAPPSSAEWERLPEIIRVLSHFAGMNLNHTHLPRGGGHDMKAIQESREDGCIELCPEDNAAYIVRPSRLFFEHFSQSPWNSFFLLELAPLEPSGVYEERDDDSEEVLEIEPHRYLDRGCLDEGNLGYDENGNQIPLPKFWRIVVRCFAGKCLIVAKRSYWNLTTSTYDGRHNRMSNEQIRVAIQEAIKDRRR